MAKLTLPLVSMGAVGQLGKGLVFMSWKGLNTVRRYVVPANPQTADQTTQRGYLTDAVTAWHNILVTATDKTAWNRYAATLSKPMSGFNAFCKMFVDFLVAGVTTPVVLRGGACNQSGAGEFDLSVDEPGEATNVFFDWGYSKTALINTETLVEGPANTWILANVAATSGARIYGRFWAYDAAALAGRSGLFQQDIL